MSIEESNKEERWIRLPEGIRVPETIEIGEKGGIYVNREKVAQIRNPDTKKVELRKEKNTPRLTGE
jgi:hypothetical protein